MNEPLEAAIVGDIVAGDYRTAGVFEQFGIDFCCGGRRSVADACRAASADPAEVVRALSVLASPVAAEDDVTCWPVDRLIDHIVRVHHAFVRFAIPRIAGYIAKLQEVHGARHPELTRVALVFDKVGGDLLQHLFKEEHVLFPYVRDLAERVRQPCGMAQSPFGTVQNPIRMMEREHRDAADEIDTIRELTNGYTPPADGCATYAVCMAEFARFEQDLHRHVHLENNVLFPKAIQLEAGHAGAA